MEEGDIVFVESTHPFVVPNIGNEVVNVEL